MFVRIAFLIFLSVHEAVLGLRDGEALAYSLLAADPNTKQSEKVKSQEAQELQEVSMAKVDEDSSPGLNAVSFAEVNKAVAMGKHDSTDACDKELEILKEALTNFCVKHTKYNTEECGKEAANVLQYGSLYHWGYSMVTRSLGTKVPVFWSGFSDFDTSGMASKTDLADFVESVNGLLLHGGGLVEQTEWGKAAQEANDLKNCPWERKKHFWSAASISMAKAMRAAKKKRIFIAVHKELEGNYSLFNSTLYQAELRYIGLEMVGHPKWNPTFEVHEIPVAKSPDCTVAPWLKRQLEKHANTTVAMTCAFCPQGLRACDLQGQVNKAKVFGTCTAGDCRNGKGAITYADGLRYEGDFKESLPHGEGKYVHDNGDSYEGGFKNGQKDGKGKYVYENGDRYEGDWRKGLQDGRGTLSYANGDRFEGNFKNGMKNGNGKLFHANGDRYEGDFKNNEMDGKGKLFHANGDRYEGDFKNDVKDGTGKSIHANGDRYEGDYKNGMRDGKGTYFYADGDRYEGGYKMNQRDGKGKLFYADGDSYEGNFQKGVQDGNGNYCFADGNCEECVFEMGQEVSCEEIPKSG